MTMQSNWRSWSGAFLLLLLAGGFSSAHAQTGPWMATFTANPDHATVAQGVPVVASYDLIVTPQGGAALAPIPLGKPAPVSGTISVNVDAALNALPPGTYTAVIRAIGPGGQAVSPAGVPFPLVVPAPGAQGPPGVSRSSTARSPK
jgi:hypothetical protein